MAADGQEKTEQASPKRRQDARQKGQVARSPELSGAVALFATVVTLHTALGSNGLVTYLQTALGSAHLYLEGQEVAKASREALLALVRTVGLSMAVGCAAGFLASVAQVGFLWTTHPLIPDFSRVNPLTGAARLFGLRGAMEAGKAVLKMIIVGWVAFVAVRAHLTDLLALVTVPDRALLATLGGLLYTLCLRVSIVFFVIAVLDYAYQRWEHEKSLKMSKQELKQEYKQSEGDPLLRQAMRQRQRDMARQRMMQDVPRADVVITNPTHFAVALSYQADSMQAPKVLAKGQDMVAARIRELATANGIPLYENPPLARTLHKEVEIGGEIPPALYAAVAEVLAFVYDRDRGKQRVR